MELVRRAEKMLIVRVIRMGLVSTIPVLLIGAFALVLKSFPVASYQAVMESFASGFFLRLFNLIFSATFGALAVYMTIFISRSYVHIRAGADVPSVGAVTAALISFFILAGAGADSFALDNLGTKSIFLAILTGFGASAMYLHLYIAMKESSYKVLSGGADSDFNKMLSTFFPILIVSLFFGILNEAIVRLFGVDSVREWIINMFNSLFMGGEPGFFKGFFFVLLSSVLWFLGIHGSDVLEGVMQTYFVPQLAANQAAVAVGGQATNILTKQFFDCFVLMGGCGATICLLLTILIVSKNRSRRSLGRAAALPMIFNINELMVFGLPIIYNPIMLVPFLTTPLVCYTTAYMATYLGWVPVITGDIEWTTPVFIGGYLATGSIAGSLMQLFNIVLGIAIYAPFVRSFDNRTEEEARRVFEDFLNFFKSCEAELANQILIYRQDAYGEFARNLTADLRHGMKKSLEMYYQPQYSYGGRCEGVEALLRWNHPIYGVIYPPLLIKLAEEGGFLTELEEEIMLRVLSDKEKIAEKYGQNVKIALNVTGITVVTPHFLAFCRQQNGRTPFAGKNLCLEITENAALSLDRSTLEALSELKAMGLKLAIDDFSMGHTSVDYLKHNLFDFIKLDGSLVRGLSTHENCREIIASILKLAESLHMTVIAEFVETEEQRETLKEIGCDCYQGWLYSPAAPLAE